MKTFNRANLPKEIKYNNSTYFFLCGNSIHPNIIRAFCKMHNYKMIGVNVLNARLKDKTDIHNKPYTPSTFIFTAPEMPRAQKMKLTDAIRTGEEFHKEINS